MVSVRVSVDVAERQVEVDRAGRVGHVADVGGVADALHVVDGDGQRVAVERPGVARVVVVVAAEADGGRAALVEGEGRVGAFGVGAGPGGVVEVVDGDRRASGVSGRVGRRRACEGESSEQPASANAARTPSTGSDALCKVFMSSAYGLRCDRCQRNRTPLTACRSGSACSTAARTVLPRVAPSREEAGEPRSAVARSYDAAGRLV